MEHVRDTLKYFPYAGIIHIRFMGQDDTVYSQPAYRKLPGFQFKMYYTPVGIKCPAFVKRMYNESSRFTPFPPAA